VKQENSKTYYYGFGYEQNLGTKVAVSLEYNKGYSLSTVDYTPLSYYEYYDQVGLGYSFYYGHAITWSEIAYISRYFFDYNDDGSWYLSSGIGLRTAKIEIVTENISYDTPYFSQATQFQNLKSSNVTLIPISFKVGYRNSIDGFFGDYFLGLTYIPGAEDKGSGNKAFDTFINKKYFNNISFNFGICIGIGWAD